MKRNKIMVMALSLILCLTVSIGLATAYFTDYEAAKGGAVLHLNGQTEIEEKLDGKNKTISVHNVGETDMVTRVKIIGDAKHMTVTLGSDWSELQSDGWYYYTKVLKCNPGSPAEGDSTSTIKAEITVNGKEDIKDFDIIVVHESARVVYDGDKVVVPEGWANVSISAN